MTEKQVDAIARVEALAKELFLDPHISKTEPHVFYRAKLAGQIKTGEDWQRLFERAVAGDPDADRVVCFSAANLLIEGQALPLHLGVHVAKVLLDRFHEPAADSHRLSKRNLFIATAVGILKNAQIKPTRNRSLHGKDGHDSGCSMVNKLLAQYDKTPLTEATIEKVWEEWVRNSGD